MSSKPENKVSVGTVLQGKYRLETQLGAGGMGEVYRAEHETIERTVAIKVLHQDLAADESVRQRFEREARAIARLKHQHCVMLYEFGFAEELEAMFAVFEYVEGRSLEHWIGRQLPIADVLEVGRQVASGMSHAHDQSIVHRDLKPENIMAVPSDEGVVMKVLDFGIARIVGDDDRGTRLTQMGQMFGTPPYMSPEQVRARLDVTASADIYSIGVMMYELIEGNLPFLGDSPIATAMSHLEDEPPPLERTGVPGALDEIVMRCLEKEPEDRFADCDALLEALRGVEWSRRDESVFDQDDFTQPAIPMGDSDSDQPEESDRDPGAGSGGTDDKSGEADPGREELESAPTVAPGDEIDGESGQAAETDSASEKADRAAESDSDEQDEQPDLQPESNDPRLEPTRPGDEEVSPETESPQSDPEDDPGSIPTLSEVDESDQVGSRDRKRRLVAAVASVAMLLILATGVTLLVLEPGEPDVQEPRDSDGVGVQEASDPEGGFDDGEPGVEDGQLGVAPGEDGEDGGADIEQDRESEGEAGEDSAEGDDESAEGDDESAGEDDEAGAEEAEPQPEPEPASEPGPPARPAEKEVDEEPSDPDPIELQRRRRGEDDEDQQEPEEPEGIELPDRD